MMEWIFTSVLQITALPRRAAWQALGDDGSKPYTVHADAIC